MNCEYFISDGAILWQRILRLTDQPIKSSFSQISPNNQITIAVVGAGGKSTTLRLLGASARDANKKVLLSTTTHFGSVAEVLSNPTEIALRFSQDTKGDVVIGAGQSAVSYRFGAFNDPDWRVATEKAEVIVVEADGSKRLPFKIPLDHEPVIPSTTDVMVLVEGMSALMKPLEQVCFRLERALKILASLNIKATPQSLLTPELMAGLIRRGYLMNEKLQPWQKRTLVVLNQCDNQEVREMALQVRDLLGHNEVVLAQYNDISFDCIGKGL